jgi:putative ABC transport system permease protein
MFLAIKEMSRAKVRFGLLIAAIGLLVFLILFQQALQNGLITSFVGAIRNQDTPVLVYSVDGQRVIQGSVITPDLEAQVGGVDGVGQVGRIGQGTFTATAPDDAGETFDLTLLGYEAGPDGTGLGAPRELAEGRYPTAAGEAVASTEGDVSVAVGDVVTVQPGGLELTVVGLAEDVQLNVSTTFFAGYDTYVAAVSAANPDAGEPLPNVLGVAPADGVTDAELVDRINAVSPELDALTRDDAAAETPGVAQVQQSFQIIFLLYGLVVPCVTGLFFLIVTFQKADALTLLRAIGAPAGRLVSSLLIQVVLIVGLGLVVGTLLYFPVSRQQLGGIALRFDATAVLFWSVLLLTLGIGSSLIAARRVLRIDPIEATTGAGVGR